MKTRSYKTPNSKRGHNIKTLWEMTNFRLIYLVAIFLVVFDNLSFFKNVIATYPVSINNIVFLFSLVVILTAVIILLFSIFCFKYTTKPILVIILLTSSFASYFMNSYSIVIDDIMIQNIIETNSNEAFDLLNIKLFLYLFFCWNYTITNYL